MFSLKETMLMKKLKSTKWLYFPFLLTGCAILSSTLLLVITSSQMSGISGLSLPAHLFFVLFLLLLSSVLSSCSIQHLYCSVTPVFCDTQWFTTVWQVVTGANMSNWLVNKSVDEKLLIESEAMTSLSDTLLSTTIGPWYSNIGNNENFSQEFCLAARQALDNTIRLVKQTNMKSLVKDITLVTHRHLKKQTMSKVTGKPFCVEHPVSLGRISLDQYLDRHISELMTVILPNFEAVHCFPIKMVKQVIQRMMVNKLNSLGLIKGHAAIDDGNKTAPTEKISMFV